MLPKMIWTKTSLKLKAEVIYQERMAIAGRFLGGRPLCRRFLVEASRKVRGRESPQRHKGHKVRKENKSLPNPLRFGAEIPRKCLTFPIFIECDGEEL